MKKKLVRSLLTTVLSLMMLINCGLFTSLDSYAAAYTPELEIENAKIPEGIAEGTIKIPLTIKNISSFVARKIYIVPKVDIENNPFVFDDINMAELIETINPGQAKTIEFDIKISKYAEKKIYPISLEFKYVNVYGNKFTDEKLIYINVKDVHVPPKMMIKNVNISPEEIYAGEDFIVEFEAANLGTREAEEVTIKLEDSEQFIIKDLITDNYFHQVKGLEKKKVKYKLQAKEDIETGTYGLKVNVDYKENEEKQQQTIYIPVMNEGEIKKEANLIIENISEIESVESEEEFIISFDVKNQGEGSAENVKVSVETEDEIIPLSLNMFTFPEILSEDTKQIKTSFTTTEDVTTKSYPIKVKLEYKNDEETITKEQYIGVKVFNNKKENKTSKNSVPKVIIDEYSSDPGIVRAGEDFVLNISLKNTSKINAVENMKVTLVVTESSDESGSVFTPVQSSNTFYIDYMEPRGISKKQMKMYTIPDAKAKTYEIKTQFEYEYEKDDEIVTNTMEDIIGIPVVQPAKLESSDIIVEPTAFLNQPTYVTCEFYNMGKVKLQNLMVKAEGDFNTANYFVGNFEVGASDYFEGEIIPTKIGEAKGKVIISYEDTAGKEYIIEKEFTLNVSEEEPQTPRKMKEMEMKSKIEVKEMENPMEGKMGIPVWIYGVCGLVIIIIIIVIVRRRKKKGMAFNEDI